jgi:hypothetical protein
VALLESSRGRWFTRIRIGSVSSTIRAADARRVAVDAQTNVALKRNVADALWDTRMRVRIPGQPLSTIPRSSNAPLSLSLCRSMAQLRSRGMETPRRSHSPRPTPTVTTRRGVEEGVYPHIPNPDKVSRFGAGNRNKPGRSQGERFGGFTSARVMRHYAGTSLHIARERTTRTTRTRCSVSAAPRGRGHPHQDDFLGSALISIDV